MSEYTEAINDVLELYKAMRDGKNGALIMVPQRLWPCIQQITAAFSYTPAPTETGGPYVEDRAAPRGCKCKDCMHVECSKHGWHEAYYAKP